jgi:ketosteroid isomerase-like protein
VRTAKPIARQMATGREETVTTTDDNRSKIRAAFEELLSGNQKPLFDLVADDVRWTVIGSTPISGTFESKQTFLNEAVGKLTEKLAGPLVPRLIDVAADGDKVFVQWEGSATSVSGRPYEQTYCWVLTLDGGAVREVLAYLDTELVSAVMAD